MSNNRVAGGERALLGFYYQMLVTLATGALTACEFGQDQNNEYASLIASFPVRNFPVTLVPEQFGQDLTLVSGDVQVLFQMKHTAKPKDYPIRAGDFVSMLRGFAESCLEARKRGSQFPDHFGIVTNKSGGAQLNRILALVHGAQTELKAGHDVRAMMVASNKGNSTLFDDVTEWLTIPPKNKIAKPSLPSPGLVDAALHVFPRLFFVFNAPLVDWHSAFCDFARSYGATADETEKAEDQLLGRMLRMNGAEFRISKSDLVKAITGGHPNAKALTPAGAGEECAKRWRKRSTSHCTRDNWMVTRKPTNLSEMLLTKKIIFVTGDGGCGKSVLLAQITEPMIEGLENGKIFDGFVLLNSCHDTRENWIGRELGAWACHGSAGEGLLTEPLSRLASANPNHAGRRLLWIGLDGLDERFPRDIDLRDLVRTAQERDDLCILFTCRNSEVDRVKQMLSRSDTGFANFASDPFIGTITLPDFVPDEILEVLERGISPYARDRAAESLGLRFGGLSATNVPAADPNVLESLTHPRLLGAFVTLCKEDETLATRLMDGEREALLLLGQRFLRVFFNKYADRREERNMPDTEAFAALLSEVALQSQQSAGRVFTMPEWIAVAGSALAINPHLARLLLTEGLSGGLITKDGDSGIYLWRHFFVCDCLVSKEAKDYCYGK